MIHALKIRKLWTFNKGLYTWHFFFYSQIFHRSPTETSSAMHFFMFIVCLSNIHCRNICIITAIRRSSIQTKRESNSMTLHLKIISMESIGISWILFRSLFLKLKLALGINVSSVSCFKKTCSVINVLTTPLFFLLNYVPKCLQTVLPFYRRYLPCQTVDHQMKIITKTYENQL